ncbi:MAG: ABC transporter ATP-binding protein, partial [Clostridiales bacterium]|nr:ABC transporter ATP-binding protein [Clostridiales bacterium]
MRQTNSGKRPQISINTVKRLLGYITGEYRLQIIAVSLCIIISAAANASGSIFIKIIINDYISPLLLTSNPVFTGLYRAIAFMAVVYIVGVLATLFYNRVMVVISQGVLKKIRDDMFSHMQTLPIKYFDTHTFGDTMSRYTNDTDTLRQMISQSIP